MVSGLSWILPGSVSQHQLVMELVKLNFLWWLKHGLRPFICVPINDTGRWVAGFIRGDTFNRGHYTIIELTNTDAAPQHRWVCWADKFPALFRVIITTQELLTLCRAEGEEGWARPLTLVSGSGNFPRFEPDLEYRLPASDGQLS